MHRFRRYFSTALLVLLASHAGSVAATNDRVVAAGDIVTGLLPIATFAVPYFKDDTLGMKEWLRDTVVNEVLNTGLRVAFNSTSPTSNGSGSCPPHFSSWFSPTR